MGKNKKPHGHYCRVCGEYKANEKFSGKGHAAHICKACSALPANERSKLLLLGKIEGMAVRYLSEVEIKWLRGKLKDERPDVRHAAKAVHDLRFPHYERNIAKKGLTLRSLEFFIKSDVWDEYGSLTSAHMRFFADESGTIRRIDYAAPPQVRDQIVSIGQKDACRFLKRVVHELNAPFWSEDLIDAGENVIPFPGTEEEIDPDMVGYDIYRQDRPAPDAEPLWSLRLVLNRGEERMLAFYHRMYDEPQELFWSLMDFFEPDVDDWPDDEPVT